MKPPESKNAKKLVGVINSLRKVQKSSTTLLFLAFPAAQFPFPKTQT
jgi:hypothetical protein